MNRIVSLLDKWTLEERIKKDDMSVIDLIGDANAAQLAVYTETAIKNEYKNSQQSSWNLHKNASPNSTAWKSSRLLIGEEFYSSQQNQKPPLRFRNGDFVVQKYIILNLKSRSQALFRSLVRGSGLFRVAYYYNLLRFAFKLRFKSVARLYAQSQNDSVEPVR